MESRNAAGRKTGHIEALLESQLAAFSTEVTQSLRSAAAISKAEDERGYARDAEREWAIRTAKVSAKLALVAAKLRGETNLNINVRRGADALPAVVDDPPDAEGAPLPPPYEGEPPLFTPEEWASDTLTNEILWQRNAARNHERAIRAGWIDRGTPLPISRGSNMEEDDEDQND